MRDTVSIGALLSTDGTYHWMGHNALTGARHAVIELNEQGHLDFELRLEHVNPKGRLECYGKALVALQSKGIRHVFGPITSASRKDIIPNLEQGGSLLWYSCPYEGFESSESVIYNGPCPNQTLLPLLRYALDAFGGQAFLIGSNYVWGWESNRLAQEVLDAASGVVCGEKYVNLGVTAFAELIDALVSQPPAFVLNTLVGESSHAFLRQLDRACTIRGLALPVLSCNLTEGELAGIGIMQTLRLLSCGPFFEAVDPIFIQQQYLRHGPHPYSHYYASTYAAVHLFAEAYQRSGSDAPEAICAALYTAPVQTALGDLEVSPRNNHTSLPCYIAELQGSQFIILHAEPGMQPADPYLTATDLSEFRTCRKLTPARHLRIVK
ncbi:branched-chain amino acid transport system substrate-binding protein [Pseudomonas duriflava]|uniref:Branched-chain amino acid transport system substrate-binding protein n=1 Tax=Pseudomonas duriflava TaxID=459528 RepID=A0A562QP63_9PSED|nr:transporter substrate-binding protein [Pseudomonas duriflava]TWI58551.1 branched-chain amino acid transport system substrate-binding protein [Pseudomonas duriflava]